MGTLTARSQRLPGHCDHKLPTSCRLTSILDCCACADNRAHNPTYTTYVDGIGLVSRGTRWQRYCWFCKEFWTNRVAATNLEPSQTRVPDRPDQTDFLANWYEFHQGYRIVTKADGSEERIAVLGEPFEDVSPGHLPRTLDELRQGHIRSAADQVQQVEVAPTSQSDGPLLDELLDDFIAAAEEEDAEEARQAASSAPTLAIAGNVMRTSPASTSEQLQRIALLRSELSRMRRSVDQVVENLAELGQDHPDSLEITRQLLMLDESLGNITNHEQHDASNESRLIAHNQNDGLAPGSSLEERIARLTEEHARSSQQRLVADRSVETVQRHLDLARNAMVDARRERDRARRAERIASLNLQHLVREQRTAQSYRRVYGTREETERDDYVSPIGSMFDRATSRYNDAEARRRGSQSESHDSDRTVVDNGLAVLHGNADHGTNSQSSLAQIYHQFYRDNLPRNPDGSLNYSTLFTSQRPQIGWLNAPTGSPLHPQDVTAVRAVSPVSSQGHAHSLTRQPQTPRPSELEQELIEASPVQELQRARQQRATAAQIGRSFAEVRIRDTHAQRHDGDAIAYALRLPPPRHGHPRRQQRLFEQLPSDADWNDPDLVRVQDGIINMLTEPGVGLDVVDADRPRIRPFQRSRRRRDAVGLDIDDDRPEPRADAELVTDLSCKICYTQLADTACLPCGHLVMCRWCSAQHGPTHVQDRTRTTSEQYCPVCRRKVKNKVNIRLA